MSMQYLAPFKYSLILFVLLPMMVSCTNMAGALNLDTDLYLKFELASDLNPDDSDTPSPLVVRVYELNDIEKFNKSEFFDIYENDKKVLGKSLISRHLIQNLLPDTKKDVQLILGEETRYVGIFAEFSRYKESTHRSSFKITPHFDSTRKIIVNGNNIQIKQILNEKTLNYKTGA